jgi:hypothetical protein
MVRKLMTEKDLADITRQMHNRGIAEFQTKGFTEEEESKEIPGMFQDVWEAGYEHIHTLHIVPDEKTRKDYFVHADDLKRE